MACHAQDTVLGPMGGKIQVPQNSYMQQNKKQITMRLPRFLPFFFDIRRRNNLTSPWIEKLSRNGSVVLIPYFGNFGFGEVMWCKTWDPVCTSWRKLFCNEKMKSTGRDDQRWGRRDLVVHVIPLFQKFGSHLILTIQWFHQLFFR